MVNYELELVAKIAEQGYDAVLREPKFDPDSTFLSTNGRLLHNYIFNWWHDDARAHTTPTIEDLRVNFQHIPIPDPRKVSHSIPVLLDILEKKFLQQKLATVLPTLQSANELDPTSAINKMRLFLNNLPNQIGMRSMDIAESLQGLMQRNYALAQGGKGVIGIPFPWPDVNRATQGLLRTDFVLVYATGKTGKTQTCLSILSRMFSMHNCRIAILCGHEMPIEEMMEVVGCYLAKVSLARYREGKLDPEEYARLMSELENLHAEAEFPELHSRIRIFDVSDLGGPEAIESVIESYKPDVLYFDAYYSSGNPDWKVQHKLVTQGAALAKRRKTPIIVSWQRDIRRAQEDESSDDQADYSMTSAVMTKPDLVVKLFRKQNSNLMRVSNPAGRRGHFEAFHVRFDPGYPMEIVQLSGASNAGWAGDVS